MQEFFAAAIQHTERALCDELRELGFTSVRLNRGGIPFRGEWREGWRACLQSRIAQRIYIVMGKFPAATPEELYEAVRSIDWQPYITPRQTVSVRSVSVASNIHHSGFVALRAKDAIVDQIRDAQGCRPSVSRDDADVRVFIYLANNRATVYLDLSGDPLHQRGYRRDAGVAPLRETLAAAILRISGWDKRTPLIDPMCGSGTIAIEAAMWAGNIAPGLLRSRFGFERWACFGDAEAKELKSLCGELRSEVSGEKPRIVAADTDSCALEIAKANARMAGVRLSFRQQSVLDLQGAGGRRVLVTNPPYGVRLETEPDFIRKLSGVLCRLHGWRVCLLAGSDEYERAISVRPV
ncbi:MAG: RNA methyltransferase, partial [Lentisphaerae bacterium]|nr:RNA methyltransferase [Lentisphaerota bacterium]